MKRIEKIKQYFEQPVTKEQLEKIIYSIFCLIIFATPVIPELIGFGIYSLKETIFNVTTIMVAISLLIINGKKIRNIKNEKLNIYYILLIIYLILVVLSTVFTKFGMVKCITGTNGRGEGLLTIFSYIITFVIFLKGYGQMRIVSIGAVLAAIVVAIYSIIQANIPEGVELVFIPESPLGKATGTMRNQNFLSSYICIFLPMLCFYYINSTKKTILSLVGVTLLFMTLVYSVTLGGYISTMAIGGLVIIFSIVFSKKRKKTLLKIIILCITLIVTFVLINYYSNGIYMNELSKAKDEVDNLVNQNNEFGNNRMKIWEKCARVISNYPILGVGPDSLASELQKDMYITDGTNDYLNRYIVDKAHSEPLHIAATTGVPSAIIYIGLVATIGIRMLIMCIKHIKENGIDNNQSIYTTMVLISFGSYFVQSLANISVIQVAPMYWAIMGTAAGITLNKKISTL